MNKFKKIFFGILVAFLGVFVVNAEEKIFEYGGSTEKVEYTSNAFPSLITMMDYIYYNEGYVLTHLEYDEKSGVSDSSGSVVDFYSLDNELLISKLLDGKIVYALSTDGEYLYGLAINDSKKYEVIKLDGSFEIIKTIELDLTDDEKSLLEMMITSINSFFSMPLELFNVVSNVAAINLNQSAIIVNLETGDITRSVIDDEILKTYFTKSNIYFNSVGAGKQISAIAIDREKIVTISNVLECDYTSQFPTCTTTASYLTYSNENEVVFEEDVSEYSFSKIAIAGDYIVVGGFSVGEFEPSGPAYITGVVPFTPMNIYVFDFDGNLVQTLDGNDAYYLNILGNDYGFMISSLYLIEDTEDCTYVNNFYHLSFDVDSVVTEGSGVLNISETSGYNKKVTIDAIPDEGYVLGTVKVFDVDGNEIEVEANSFVMPAKDVKIEVTFVVDNPNTKDIIIFGVVLLFIGGFVTFSMFIKKYVFLR